mmetsp:Transcript_10781/g.24634  ORF Transcript_10781/g.24634 Transcript_10781/m.24634 type:complete len:277 (-) Transcript_10781:117-947(-)|eukprot:CAMPEP_0178385976 /NCGR_PEP_ID=MMETSP0689_2-20121128/8309_1 /TAXON_ID=160604 /ORGANISM="Amphidinium massartii, Strain CS-259" /LENGTH=276 /DNA_ID=CAMNT_0020006273 /DNA_START=27 /DNA_END=857 /DNA_ORIENTATION=+
MDAEKIKKLVIIYAKHQSVQVWGGFAVAAFVIYWMFSSGDFSFLLTLSSLVSMFSFLMVAMVCETTKSVKGVSLKMMECYIAVFFCRLCAIIPFEGYLPFDKSGDWFYQLCEVFGLCLSGSIVYLCRVHYASTYDSNTDVFNHLWIIVPAFVISLILHPHLNAFLPSDIAWAFALYLESVTVLPQLFMFMKDGKAQPHTSHFLAAQALSRLFSFIFWASSFSELSNPNHNIKRFVGHWVVGIQLLQLIIMGDFIYHYIRCIQKGLPVSEIPFANNV